MNADKFFTLLGSIVILATVTAVLSSKNTSGIITSGFGGFSNALRAASGR